MIQESRRLIYKLYIYVRREWKQIWVDENYGRKRAVNTSTARGSRVILTFRCKGVFRTTKEPFLFSFFGWKKTPEYKSHCSIVINYSYLILNVQSFKKCLLLSNDQYDKHDICRIQIRTFVKNLICRIIKLKKHRYLKNQRTLTWIGKGCRISTCLDLLFRRRKLLIIHIVSWLTKTNFM